MYYLLASIPFARYHFLRVRAFLVAAVRSSNITRWSMAAGVGLLLVTLPGVSGAWRLRLALAGGIPAVWMAVVARVPDLHTYENAIAMCSVPLLLCAAAAILDVARPSGGTRADRGRANTVA